MMASKFENVGMGMLGSEQNYMHGGGDTAKFLLGALLDKLTKKNPSQPMAEVEDRSTSVVPPPTIGVVPSKPSETNVDEHPDTNNVLKDLGFSFVTPDKFSPRNPSLDVVPTQMGFAPPPPQMNLPQYSQNGSNNSANVLATIASLFA